MRRHADNARHGRWRVRRECGVATDGQRFPLDTDYPMQDGLAIGRQGKDDVPTRDTALGNARDPNQRPSRDRREHAATGGSHAKCPAHADDVAYQRHPLRALDAERPSTARAHLAD